MHAVGGGNNKKEKTELRTGTKRRKGVLGGDSWDLYLMKIQIHSKGESQLGISLQWFPDLNKKYKQSIVSHTFKHNTLCAEVDMSLRSASSTQ